MTVKSMCRLLRRHYSPNRYMRERFPKAAKKRRVLKKWRNRFGDDLEDHMRQMIYGESFLKTAWYESDLEPFTGANLVVPFGSVDMACGPDQTVKLEVARNEDGSLAYHFGD